MLLFCETNQISKTLAILSEKTLNNLSFCKHFPRFPNPNCNFRSKIFFATIILGYSAWICNADLSNKTVLHAFHRFYLINLLKKKGALNKATTSKRKAGGWSSKMCCSWGCGKFNFLLNTQCLEPTSKEVFAQDIYLNGERILHNQQQFKGKLHLGRKGSSSFIIIRSLLINSAGSSLYAEASVSMNPRQDIWEEASP